MTRVPPLLLSILVFAGISAVCETRAQTRHTTPLSIGDVQSFDYFIAPGFDGAPRPDDAWRAAAAESYDLLIANYHMGHNRIEAASVRAYQDSSPRGRLAIAYIDAGEFMRCCSNINQAEQNQWFDAEGNLTSAAPGWLGPRNPGFNNLWLAKVWAPEWQAYILSEIDKIISLGFDGVFLDTLYHDGAWGPKGFAGGQNAGVDYREAQVGFAKAIWNHVHKDLNKSGFIIITNYSGVSDDDAPALTEGLNYSDAFMKEATYFGRNNMPAPWVAGKPIEQYFAARYTRFFSRILQRHKVIFLQDYNLTFDNEALMLKECAQYGYLESNTHMPQNLIHIDGLASCAKQVCSATNAAGEHALFKRSADAP